MTSIIDTNVILVANGQHQDVGPDCVTACALRLQALMKNQRFALDDAFEILSEYQNKTNPNAGKGPGDAFIKWALRNHANPKLCDLVSLNSHPERGYTSFPDDTRLANFDAPDRKFVAVAATHSDHPPILQAADCKWVDWAPALKDHGIEVDFLCPDDVQRFHAKKFGT